jgi:hypothetical protein
MVGLGGLEPPTSPLSGSGISLQKTSFNHSGGAFVVFTNSPAIKRATRPHLCGYSATFDQHKL